MKLLLNEDLFELVVPEEIPRAITKVDVEEVVSEVPTAGPENGIANLLIAAINDEWATISAYNDLVVNANAESMSNISTVIEDILVEENKHVGQLQAALETISPNAVNVENGHLEGQSQLTEGYLESSLVKYAQKVADQIEEFLHRVDLPSSSKVGSNLSRVERVELGRAADILNEFARAASMMDFDDEV